MSQSPKVTTQQGLILVVQGSKHYPDPVRVIVEGHEKTGSGRVTVACINGLWTHYWPNIGDVDILTFFSRSANLDYIANKLSTHSDRVQVIDMDATVVVVRKRVREEFTNGDIDENDLKTLEDILAHVDTGFSDTDTVASNKSLESMIEKLQQQEFYVDSSDVITRPSFDYRMVEAVAKAAREGVDKYLSQQEQPTPCDKCPWRRDSAPGYLGGTGLETFIINVDAMDGHLCHKRNRSEDGDVWGFDGKQCVGAQVFFRNTCKMPKVQRVDPLPEADRETVFSNWSEFRDHHKLAEEKD